MRCVIAIFYLLKVGIECQLDHGAFLRQKQIIMRAKAQTETALLKEVFFSCIALFYEYNSEAQ